MKKIVILLSLTFYFTFNAFSQYSYQDGYDAHYERGKMYATWDLVEVSPMIVDGKIILMERIRPDYGSYNNVRNDLGRLQQLYPDKHNYFQGCIDGLYYGFYDNIDQWKPKGGIGEQPDEP
ncbi:hypothetical protein [Proteiniphilum acetatigenes]|uniref:hypothetical protein n=1 Tax=Proteiniphilum acetatigenes TaxID=294710 RepID=UPI000371D039|nr:hypothetical protein [Proteiniphilum acetatigenes]